MTFPSSSDTVPTRVCTGQLAVAGRPRHPRPAQVKLSLPQDHAVDFGCPPGEPLDLRPLQDAIAATYDGCTACLSHQIEVIAADPALTTYTVGTALTALNPDGPAPDAEYLVSRLHQPGAAIVLTMRCDGTRAAADVVWAMSDEQRHEAVAVAVELLLPVHWYYAPLPARYDPAANRRARDDDRLALRQLRDAGMLPPVQ